MTDSNQQDFPSEHSYLFDTRVLAMALRLTDLRILFEP
jgi:hypothetical protein